MTTYQVSGHMATVRTMTSSGFMWITLYRGSILPPDADPDRIKHLLDVNLIRKVEDGTAAGVDAAGAAIAHPPVDKVSEGVKTPEGDEGAAQTEEPELPPPADETEREARREAARAKLPTDGSAPDGRASQQVWAEYAVRNGYDRGMVETTTKADLVALFR
jgi:hypothetical protein